MPMRDGFPRWTIPLAPGIYERLAWRAWRPALSWGCEQEARWNMATVAAPGGGGWCRLACRRPLVRSCPSFRTARLWESGADRVDTVLVSLSPLNTARYSARSRRRALCLRPERGDLPDDNDRCRSSAASWRSHAGAGHHRLRVVSSAQRERAGREAIWTPSSTPGPSVSATHRFRSGLFPGRRLTTLLSVHMATMPYSAVLTAVFAPIVIAVLMLAFYATRGSRGRS